MTDQEEEKRDGLPLEEPTEEPQDEREGEAQAQGAAAEAESNEKTAAEAASVYSLDDIPAARPGGAPVWVEMPPGLKFPRGKQIIFMKFKAAWTDTPWKGSPITIGEEGEVERDPAGNPVLYRQCIVWPINTADKKFALDRAKRDPNRATDELSKQMIRVVDGKVADWGAVQQDGIEVFWNEIGEKCRALLTRLFTRLHVMDVDSTRDFLQNCIEVRSTDY